jgi:cell division septal protein FtsQ
LTRNNKTATKKKEIAAVYLIRYSLMGVVGMVWVSITPDMATFSRDFWFRVSSRFFGWRRKML